MEGLFRSKPKLCSPDPLKQSNDIILEHEYMNSDATVEREMKCFFVLCNFFSPIVSLCLCFCLLSAYSLSHSFLFFCSAVAFYIFTHVVRELYLILCEHTTCSLYLCLKWKKNCVFGADIMHYNQLYMTLLHGAL